MSNPKLDLNKTTVEILDDKSLQNAQGGDADGVAGTCILLSCDKAAVAIS